MNRPHLGACVLFAATVGVLCAAVLPAAAAEEPEDRVVSILKELAERLVAVDSDCDSVASVLTEWTTAHHDELPKLAAQTQQRELEPARQSALERSLAPSLETIFVASMTCSEHDPTQQALAVLDSLLTGDAP